MNIPYGKQQIASVDMDEVCKVLISDWLTTGPIVDEFEQAVADFCGVRYGVAVSSGTAALHCAMKAIDVGPGDEVIVPAITFAATASAIVHQGGRPVFADVDPETLLIDPDHAGALINSNTKAIVAVDYAGQTCDYQALRTLADKHHLALVADSCHALGATYRGTLTGGLADITLFSFHPVKHITTGEGGMAVTDSEKGRDIMKRFRNHGIETDFRERERLGSWYYEVRELGYNYRIPDILCALGVSQLKRLPQALQRRAEIARRYADVFENNPLIRPLHVRKDSSHAWHLYVIRIESKKVSRDRVFAFMRKRGIGVNVHYIPVYHHPYYREKFGYQAGLCPAAEYAYNKILSIPMWPGVTDAQVDEVASLLFQAVEQGVA